MPTRQPRRLLPSLSDSLSAYLDEIGSYPLLSPQEENRIARLAHAGDEHAVDALVCANLRFVVSVAKRYRRRGMSMEDLIGDGNVGLVRAARRFDPAFNVRFTTYAMWFVRQAIQQGIAMQTGIVRVPLDRVATLQRVGRESRRLAQALGREPTDGEVAAEVELPAAEVAHLRSVARAALSLDAGGHDAPAPSEQLMDPVVADPGAPIMQRELAADLECALGDLPAREAHTLRLAFGLDGEEPRSLLEIGRTLGVTRERARQIKVIALGRLRDDESGYRLSRHRA